MHGTDVVRKLVGGSFWQIDERIGGQPGASEIDVLVGASTRESAPGCG